ncbi:assimilatory nitrate reductase electron transfer subunit NasB [Bacillus subtilis]|uniref:assimilatory nitrate reductase electron transfer subunit NasB n=1 Tax=Bacillus subtilis TaxID=1423 RepID=UPI00100A022F|nr:assimilatory nitrate reductase electron transfer subunit NasB [Bacillus subtilis]MDK7655986.1 assimilatory nitrate reductase electron transfer subunit NasB [Bacillus subtilis]MEC1958595.1 assimilatory nitrate reductase electron transfer subunit NasB [Bacillus subtilis]MEC2236773.1 assimilatory nitrate reductase electron transfer subunit NasB [Bacillus subtilis]MED4865374.1 assimilatory nitrate reductase electron transfer subunit NasB [Bacillus subtilis]QAW31721.1 assimilatory nitrate reduct
MKKQRLVLAGNGMAGIRCIEEVLKLNRHMFEIVIFGSEPHPNYNRILLSSVLQGEASIDDITLNSKDWYDKHGITLYTGETVIQIDTDQQQVITDRKRILSYDKFIVATGSSPHILPIPGADKKGVYGFRTIEDCQALMKMAQHFQKAAVIGAGLLGLEAAVGLQHLGMDVSVIHHSAGIMQKQLDQTAARLLQTELEQKGLTFLLEKDTVSISGTTKADRIHFKDGSSLKADLIVMAAGVRPNIELAVSAGIQVNRGIIVNDFMQTSEPNIYAVGECAEHNGTVYGLVAPLYEQGKVLASHICGVPCEEYQGSAPSAALKIAGIDVWSAGKIQEDERTTSIKIYDEQAGVYKKALFVDDKLAGVILFGDTRDKQRLLDSLLKQRDISIVKKQIIEPETSGTLFESMPSSETICQCNTVTKGAIEDAVNTKSLTTVEEVKHCTKASGSCGGCKPLVEDLLRYMTNSEYTKPAGTLSFCSCTDFTEDDIIAELQRRPFTNPAEVMNQLDWKTKNGCSTCVPAIQYYLEMLYPGFVQPEPATEETCILIPQMYGGRTNAEQLRTIANIIEAYSISDVSITHGQRLKLSGIKPADLPNMKKDLKMPVYTNEHRHTLQTIKACTCGQNRSIQQLAAQIERQLETLPLPAPISISLSCETDCTDAALQDIGAIRTQAGWDIHIGGVRGTHARSGALFCVTENEDSTAGMIKGLIQYYRETAHYLEAVHQWIDRLGIVHIREVLFEEDLRAQLLESLQTDLSLIQNPTVETGAYKKG